MPTKIWLQSRKFVVNPQCGVQRNGVRTRATTLHCVGVEQILQILATANAGHIADHRETFNNHPDSKHKLCIWLEGKVCST